jgi:hypothetical protein
MNKIIPIIILVIPMFNLFSQNTSSKKFWNWFEKNEDRLFNFEKEQNKIFNELKAQLDKIDSNLVFEFSSIQNGKREFVISADGHKQSFPSVERLHSDAPKLNRWIFIPFRPRREALDEVEYQGIKIRLKEIAFELNPNQNKIDIVLYIKNYYEINRDIYVAILFHFLDAILGEYDVEMKVGRIDLKSSEEISNFNDHNIRFLSKKFDELFSRVN